MVQPFLVWCCCPAAALLLPQVAGTSGKVKLDGGSDDEGAACETYGTAISAALGKERNAEVLSKLYVARSDVQYLVRNTALHIWKTIVVNTPRTLQEILPALMAEVIEALADPGEVGRWRGWGGGTSTEVLWARQCRLRWRVVFVLAVIAALGM
jgi:hypothetical protein